MDPRLFPSVDRPIRPGIGEQCFSGIGVVGIGTLLLPQSNFRNVVAMPAMLWIAYTLRQYSSGPVEQDYLMAVNVTLAIAKMVDMSVMRTPEKELRRIRADGSVETPEEITNMTLWQKFCWTLDLVTTSRGIGWNWQVKNIEEVPKGTSRKKYVLGVLFRIAYCFIFIDIHEWFMLHRSPFVGPGPWPSLFDLPLSEQIFYTWSRAIHSGFNMAIGYNVLAAVAVGSGLSRPERWPPIFGSFLTKGYTIRNCWGYCWHQFLRRLFETANGTVTSILRVKRGTLVSRYLQLYNAFFISAVIHHIGSWNVVYMPTAWYQFYWFMIQPVAITVEDFAIYLGKKAGLQDSWKTRAVGYAWVAAFLSYGLRYPVAMFFDYGLANVRHPLVASLSIMDRIFG